MIVLDLDKLRNSPDKFRNELTPRIKGLMPIACFSYASVVVKVFYYAERKGKIYIGLASNSLMDRKNTDKLISTRFVNHCWFESEEGKIYETNLRAPHLYSLRELTPRARTLTYKDNTVVY